LYGNREVSRSTNSERTRATLVITAADPDHPSFGCYREAAEGPCDLPWLSNT